MPIIINEIEIAVEVVPDSRAQDNQAQSTGGLRRDDIIRECVEKVMEIMNLKNER